MVADEALWSQHCLLTWDTLVRTADLSPHTSDVCVSYNRSVYVCCGRDCVLSAHQTQGPDSNRSAAGASSPHRKPAGGDTEHAQHHPSQRACFIHHLSCESDGQADKGNPCTNIARTQSVSQGLIADDEELCGVAAGRASFLLALSSRSADEASTTSRMAVLRLEDPQAAESEQERGYQCKTHLLTEDAVSWAAGGDHYLVAVRSGAVLGWGGNLHHQSSQQDIVVVPYPQIFTVLLGLRVTIVAAGLNHSLALSDCGDVYSWGANECGQLGHGTIAQGEAKPRLIERIGNQDGSQVTVTCISAGSRHCLAMNEEGIVYGWGWAHLGQLGKCSQNHGQLLVHAEDCKVEWGDGSRGFLLTQQQDHRPCLCTTNSGTCKLAPIDSTGLLRNHSARCGQTAPKTCPQECLQQSMDNLQGSEACYGGFKPTKGACERTGEPGVDPKQHERDSKEFVDDSSHGQCVLEPVAMYTQYARSPGDADAQAVRPLVAASCRAEWWHSVIVLT